MTLQDYRKRIQSEIKQEGFNAVISEISSDDKLHTVLKFNQPVTNELYRWINSRYMYGATLFDQFTIKLNHPNEKA